MRLTALTVRTVTETSTDAVEIAFQPRRPLRVRTGQAGLIMVPGGGTKPFTFASASRGGQVSIATTLHSGSTFKRALAALQPGDRVRSVAAFGGLPFVPASQSQVFVAQGIGITPFLAMARSNGSVNATLLQVGAPHFFDEVAAATGNDAEHHDHREDLSEAVRRTIIARPYAAWFVSGHPDFVTAVAAQLAEGGVPTGMTHQEKFFGKSAPRTAPRWVGDRPTNSRQWQRTRLNPAVTN